MANLDHLHDQILVIDGIYDTITSWSEPVFSLTGEFLAAEGARGLGQVEEALDEPPAVPFQGNGFNFFDRRRFYKEPKSCHAAANPSELPQKAGWVRPGAPRTRPGLPYPQTS